ncbi:MAG: hypothetical protein WBD40_14105 [Tepidisphaeraceae bacterium]
MRSLSLRHYFTLLPSSFILILSGCQLLGVVSQALPPPTVVPQYQGLAGKSLGVMVWADRGTRIEYEWIQLDLANSIQTKLQQTAADKKAKVKELKGTTFPVLPRSIIRFQQDNSEIEGQVITEVAPRLGLQRLIYVEIEDFATRPDGAVELFRGDGKVTLRLVEINPDGTARVAFEENEVSAEFPRGAPKEGKPSIGDRRTYVGLIDELGAAIARRFVPYPEEQ